MTVWMYDWDMHRAMQQNNVGIGEIMKKYLEYGDRWCVHIYQVMTSLTKERMCTSLCCNVPFHINWVQCNNEWKFHSQIIVKWMLCCSYNIWWLLSELFGWLHQHEFVSKICYLALNRITLIYWSKMARRNVNSLLLVCLNE